MDWITFGICFASAMPLFVIGWPIRSGDRIELINIVRVERPRDRKALAQFAGRMLYWMGLAIVAAGFAVAGEPIDRATKNLFTLAFAAAISLLSIVLVVGVVRHQNPV